MCVVYVIAHSEHASGWINKFLFRQVRVEIRIPAGFLLSPLVAHFINLCFHFFFTRAFFVFRFTPFASC